MEEFLLILKQLEAKNLMEKCNNENYSSYPPYVDSRKMDTSDSQISWCRTQEFFSKRLKKCRSRKGSGWCVACFTMLGGALHSDPLLSVGQDSSDPGSSLRPLRSHGCPVALAMDASAPESYVAQTAARLMQLCGSVKGCTCPTPSNSFDLSKQDKTTSCTALLRPPNDLSSDGYIPWSSWEGSPAYLISLKEMYISLLSSTSKKLLSFETIFKTIYPFSSNNRKEEKIISITDKEESTLKDKNVQKSTSDEKFKLTQTLNSYNSTLKSVHKCKTFDEKERTNKDTSKNNGYMFKKRSEDKENVDNNYSKQVHLLLKTNNRHMCTKMYKNPCCMDKRTLSQMKTDGIESRKCGNGQPQHVRHREHPGGRLYMGQGSDYWTTGAPQWSMAPAPFPSRLWSPFKTSFSLTSFKNN